MELEVLKRRLTREIKANPAKAGVLGVLMLVAAWFWIPLVAGWTTADKKDSPLDFVETLAATLASRVEPEASTGEETTAWKDLVEWMAKDDRMEAAGMPLLTRSPFAHLEPPELEEGAGGSKSFEPAPIAIHVTPKSLGIRLTSTIVGSRRKVAMIDGRTYREGNQIWRAYQGTNYGFQLTDVQAASVVLLRDGKRYELKLERAEGSNVIYE